MAIRYHSNLQNCNRWSYDITGFIKHYVIKNKYIYNKTRTCISGSIDSLVSDGKAYITKVTKSKNIYD